MVLNPIAVLLKASVIGLVLTFGSYAIGQSLGWVTELNWLEVFAVWTSYASTYLCVVQSRYNYVFGVVTTIAYAFLFYQWGLYGSALTNVYLPIALLYGWFRWGPDGKTRKVTHASKTDWYWSAIIVALVTGAIFALLFWLNLPLPWTDVLILELTILAQWLLDNKKLETWFVWMAVNVFAIYTYFSAELYLAAFQYVFFLGNAVWGWLEWRKSASLDSDDYVPIENDVR